MRVRNYLAMGVVALAAVALPATSASASVTSSPGNHTGFTGRQRLHGPDRDLQQLGPALGDVGTFRSCMCGPYYSMRKHWGR
jgi:hypothetical protein